MIFITRNHHCSRHYCRNGYQEQSMLTTMINSCYPWLPDGLWSTLVLTMACNRFFLLPKVGGDVFSRLARGRLMRISEPMIVDKSPQQSTMVNVGQWERSNLRWHPMAAGITCGACVGPDRQPQHQNLQVFNCHWLRKLGSVIAQHQLAGFGQCFLHSNHGTSKIELRKLNYLIKHRN